MKRLWEGYELLKRMTSDKEQAEDKVLDEKVRKLLFELDEFMSDDFHTAKVLANLFDLTPVINSIKDKHISASALGSETIDLMKKYFTNYLENILGLKDETATDDNKLNGVVELLIQIRKDAKGRKDYATSDKIRNQLQGLGILLKDEKDGNMSYTFA